MTKYKILVSGRFMEGWKPGDIVDMDDEAARVPLEEGAIERIPENYDVIFKKHKKERKKSKKRK